MEAIKVITTLDQALVDLLPGSKSLVGKKVEITITAAESNLIEPRRRGGWAKGKIWVSDDFDEPLEDFRDYM